MTKNLTTRLALFLVLSVKVTGSQASGDIIDSINRALLSEPQVMDASYMIAAIPALQDLKKTLALLKDAAPNGDPEEIRIDTYAMFIHTLSNNPTQLLLDIKRKQTDKEPVKRSTLLYLINKETGEILDKELIM